MSYFRHKDSVKSFGDPKPEKVIKKKKGLIKKTKPTGEYSLFQEIWLERPHFCSHCSDALPEAELGADNKPVVNPMFFDHILTKKQSPELRLDRNNIRLLCFDCHFVRHNRTKEEFDNRKYKNI